MTLDEGLEILRQQYYQAILLLQEKEDIINALPEPEYNNFFNIITGIIEMIDIEMNKLNLLLSHESNDEMKEYMQEEIDILEFKKQICLQRKKDAEETKDIEEAFEISQTRKLIFATTSSRKVYLEEDLKEIAEEYYDDVAECLKQLENTQDLKTIEKQISNNGKMSKIHELRPFKIRVCYKALAPDLVYIIIAKYKKSDNDRIEREKIIERNKQTKLEFEQLKEDIKDPIKKQQIIDTNNQIKDRVLEYISTNKRGTM